MYFALVINMVNHPGSASLVSVSGAKIWQLAVGFIFVC
jgi:hypothetical protein